MAKMLLPEDDDDSWLGLILPSAEMRAALMLLLLTAAFFFLATAHTREVSGRGACLSAVSVWYLFELVPTACWPSKALKMALPSVSWEELWITPYLSSWSNGLKMVLTEEEYGGISEERTSGTVLDAWSAALFNVIRCAACSLSSAKSLLLSSAAICSKSIFASTKRGEHPHRRRRQDRTIMNTMLAQSTCLGEIEIEREIGLDIDKKFRKKR